MTEPTRPIMRAGGFALIAGGALAVIVNGGLTPMLATDAPFAEMAASTVFAWRMPLAAVVALLLLVGAVGLYIRHAAKVRWGGAIAFFLAFVGSAVLLAHEWNQALFVRDLALRVPEGLEALENAEGMTLFDWSAMLAVVTFSIGWIAVAAWLLATRAARRLGPTLVLVGFFAVPPRRCGEPRRGPSRGESHSRRRLDSDRS